MSGSQGRLTILVIGGCPRADNRKLASAEVRDPVTEGFGAAGTLGRARVGHSATRLRDGRVPVVGGIRAAQEIVADVGR